MVRSLPRRGANLPSWRLRWDRASKLVSEWRFVAGACWAARSSVRRRSRPLQGDVARRRRERPRVGSATADPTREGSQHRALQAQQLLLSLEPAAVADEAARGADDAMAGEN